MSSLPLRASSMAAACLLEDPPPKRVAVLRALQLGDLLCAVPVFRALRRALPHATITLIGLPWAQSFAKRFAAYVDEFIEFPGYHGLPERQVDEQALRRFFDDARRREFDLAIQLHGSGSFVNECIARLGARRSAGFFQPGDIVPDLVGFIPWPSTGNETQRLLSLARHLGAPVSDDELEFPLDHGDHAALTDALSCALGVYALDDAPYVCVHPGARFSSRRWPPERFAAVADALAARGFTVCVTGTSDERAITSAVVAAMRNPCIDLTGQLTLGAFAALVRGATVVVANDTGISHIAAAVRTRSVIIASGSDVRRWAPRDIERHWVLWRDLDCRPCMHETCPIGHPCALSVDVDAVVRAASALVAARAQDGGARQADGPRVAGVGA